MSAPQIVVDVGFSSPTIGDVFTVGDAIKGEVNLYPISGDIWVDVSEYVRTWRIRYGAARGDDILLRYDAATAVIELNDGDRRFDPENLAGPHVAGGVSQVQAMRRVRIRAVWNGTSYPIFYGFSDDFEPNYIGNDWTVTTLTATDASKVFGSIVRGAVGAVGASEDSGARVTRILDGISWPAEDRVIAVGDTTLQATTLEGNTLAELQLVQDSEMGEVYLDRQGRAVFRNRQAMITETRSTVAQAVFGDAPGEIPYADVKPSTGAENMANTITITRVGGAPQQAADPTSVAQFLIRTFERSDLLMETDLSALGYAEALLYQYGEPRRRFQRIEFNAPRPDVEDVYWPAVLSRELADRVTVIRRPAGGGDPIERDCFVRGMEMGADQSEDFKVSFVLQSADRYSFFVIGDPILGAVGGNAIAY